MKPVLVLFGTISGNSENCAHETVKALATGGIAARSVNMMDFTAAGLASEHTVLICVSTYGDGEPPFDGTSFWEEVTQGEPLAAGQLRFSVCGLGDTAYEKFCQCGKDFDAALERHGAQRIAARVDCDVDYERLFRQWLTTVVAALKQQMAISDVATA